MLHDTSQLPYHSLLDHLVRLQQHARRDREPEGLGRLQVEDELKLHRLLDGQVGGLGAFEELVHIGSGAAEEVTYAWSIGHQTVGHSPGPSAGYARQVLLGGELGDLLSVYTE